MNGRMKHESDLERKMGDGGTDGVLRPSRIWGDRGGVQPISVSQSLSSLWLITMTHPVLGGVGVQPISTLSSRTQTPPKKNPPKKTAKKRRVDFGRGEVIELVVSRALSLGTPSPRLDQLHHSRSNPYPSTKQQVACQTGIPSMRHNIVNNNVVL